MTRGTPQFRQRPNLVNVSLRPATAISSPSGQRPANKLTHAALLAAFALTFSSGCGVEESPAPALTTQESFARDFDAALCALNERCNLGYMPAGAACLTEAHKRELMSVPQGSLQVVQLDEAAAQLCVNALNALECAEAYRLFDTGELIGQCQASFVGSVPEGELCYHPAECAPGLSCDTLGAACPWRCRAFEERCTSGVDCYWPSFCDASGACVPQGALGANCRNSWSDFECEGALICKEGVCSEPLGVGSLCDLEVQRCEMGLFCEADSVGDFRCIAPVFGVGDGEPCDFALLRCGNGLFCQHNTTQLCEPDKTLSEDCGNGAERCELDLTCIRGVGGDPQANTCQVPRAVGEPCLWGGDCDSGVCVGNACAASDDENVLCLRPVS